MPPTRGISCLSLVLYGIRKDTNSRMMIVMDLESRSLVETKDRRTKHFFNYNGGERGGRKGLSYSSTQWSTLNNTKIIQHFRSLVAVGGICWEVTDDNRPGHSSIFCQNCFPYKEIGKLGLYLSLLLCWTLRWTHDKQITQNSRLD